MTIYHNLYGSYSKDVQICTIAKSYDEVTPNFSAFEEVWYI